MRRSFGAWLAMVFLLSIVLPLLGLTGFFAAYFDRLFALETTRLFDSTLYGVSQSISTYVSDLARLSMMPYFQSDILGYYMDMDQGRYLTDQIVATRINKEYQLAVSQQLANVRQDVKGVLFAPFAQRETTAFLVRRYAGELEVLRDPSLREEDWFEGAIAANGNLYFPPVRPPAYYETLRNTNFHTDADYSTFSVARLIKQPDSMRPIGVIKVDAVNRVIVDLFRHIDVGESSALVLLDQAGQPIYATRPVAQSLLASITPVAQTIRGEENTYHVSSYPVMSTPWRLLYLAAEPDVQGRTRAIYLFAVLLGILSLGISSLLFYLNSRSAVRAEKKILSAMRRLAAGDLNVRLELPKHSYYAAIAGALNQTVDQLNAHITNEYKAVLNQRNAEYMALQTQVNPHFLYNILSGFVTLNRIGERDTLERLLLKLSHLFRYSCKHEDAATVAEEFTFLEEYLALQKLRFAERLQYSITHAPGTQDIALPRLLLQPLVENALVHGLEPIDRPVRIQVFADIITRPDGADWLLLCVWDDAEGFDMRVKAEGRIGLANVEERLALFHSHSVFSIHSSPGNGCQCTVLLPLKHERRS
ncbi:MAG: histidine kinase [Clostridia bacterium]|nr:histidine kinase [Clostridia bacterium]